MQFKWGGAFEGWAKNFVKDNQWRVRNYLGTFEDGVQQCAMVFTYCNNLYEKKVDNERWFMALFKTAVKRHFHTLAERDSNLRTAEATFVHDESEAGPLLDNLLTAGESMSPELAAVFHIIANGPREMLELLFEDRQTLMAGYLGETAKLNNRWRRLLGIKANDDLVKELMRLLENSDAH
jgi:hypothetical protein